MRALLAILAIVLTLGAATGIYFATRGANSEIPKEQRSTILDEAKTRGVIESYRLLASGGGQRAWEVDGGQVFLRAYGPYGHGPAPAGRPPLFIEYVHSAAAKARTIWQIAGRGHLAECGPC